MKNDKIMSFTTNHLVNESTRKLIYSGVNNDLLIIGFKDNLLWLNESGMVWNLINEQIFNVISDCQIPNHFIKRINIRQHEVRNTCAFPFEVRITNIITHSLHALLKLERGTVLKRPIVEFVAKHEEVIHVVEPSYLRLFDWCKEGDFDTIKNIALRINDIIRGFFYRMEYDIAECTLRFGIFESEFAYHEKNLGHILVINDFTPYNLAFWNKKQNKVMDIDRELLIALTTYLGLVISQS